MAIISTKSPHLIKKYTSTTPAGAQVSPSPKHHLLPSPRPGSTGTTFFSYLRVRQCLTLPLVDTRDLRNLSIRIIKELIAGGGSDRRCGETFFLFFSEILASCRNSQIEGKTRINISTPKLQILPSKSGEGESLPTVGHAQIFEPI